MKWEDEILSGDFTLETAADLGASSYLAALYGLDDVWDANNSAPLLAAIRDTSSDLASFRSSVDFLTLMDMDDPPLYLSSQIVPEDISLVPTNLLTSALLHHPAHPAAVQTAANNAGVTNMAYIPKVGIDTTNGISVIEFLLNELN